jgi:hypothetical protein
VLAANPPAALKDFYRPTATGARPGAALFNMPLKTVGTVLPAAGSAALTNSPVAFRGGPVDVPALDRAVLTRVAGTLLARPE